ncbi:MAG: hypothetical protein A2350_07225 [Candidatus Raymondbacteria bacterium RifOxyB12_full_50_8]|nr:MAG: hypothetical protein A2350_07225 [Candidatus Raymondbacteria bacterium RifOxyB12_full_50_8]
MKITTLLPGICFGIVSFSIFAQQDSNNTLFPCHFTYEGAFLLDAGPTVDADGKWNYGGEAFAYYREGDPDGPNDGYPGSLFGSGFEENDYLAEVSIPAPVISPTKSLADLPKTTPLQGFANPFASLPGYQRIGIGGLLCLPAQGQQDSAKLYANLCDDYKSLPNAVTMSWMDLDLSNPNIAGFWRAGRSIEWNIGRYMFEIPKSWADVNTPGRILASGRMRNWGGMGPNLFAYAPWNENNPPVSGDTLDSVTTLLEYGTSEQEEDRGFSICSWYRGGAWITVGNRSAIIIYAQQNYSLDWSYFSGPFGAGRYPSLLFYDPADVADVVQGRKQSFGPKWYARKNLDIFFFGKKKAVGGNKSMDDGFFQPGGIAYDRERGIVYVAQTHVSSNAFKPIIHVFRIDTMVTARAETTHPVEVRTFDLTTFPNPFNAQVTIALWPVSFGRMPQKENIVLDIHDIRGIHVTSIHSLPDKPYKFTWDAGVYPSGTYLVRAKIGKSVVVKAVTLLK